MLSIEVKENEEKGTCECAMAVSGNADLILRETVAVIHGIYLSVQSQATPKQAEVFRSMLTLFLVEPESPVWNTKASNKVVMAHFNKKKVGGKK